MTRGTMEVILGILIFAFALFVIGWAIAAAIVAVGRWRRR